MISLEDVPEMLESYKSGDLDFRDVYSLCLDLFEHHDVADVFTSFPADLHKQLASQLRAVYDNDIPPNNFLLLDSARGDHPAKHVIIDKIRAWLGHHPAEPASHDTPEEER